MAILPYRRHMVVSDKSVSSQTRTTTYHYTSSGAQCTPYGVMRTGQSCLVFAQTYGMADSFEQDRLESIIPTRVEVTAKESRPDDIQRRDRCSKELSMYGRAG